MRLHPVQPRTTTQCSARYLGTRASVIPKCSPVAWLSIPPRDGWHFRAANSAHREFASVWQDSTSLMSSIKSESRAGTKLPDPPARDVPLQGFTASQLSKETGSKTASSSHTKNSARDQTPDRPVRPLGSGRAGLGSGSIGSGGMARRVWAAAPVSEGVECARMSRLLL